MTPQQAKILAQAKKDVIEINKLYKEMGKTKVFAMPTDDVALTARELEKINREYERAVDNAERLVEAERDMAEEINGLFNGLQGVNDEIKGGKQGFDLTKKAVTSLTSVVGKVKDIQDDILNANSADLIQLQQKALAERKNLEAAQDLLIQKSKTTKLSISEEAALANVNGMLEDNHGLFGDIEDTLAEIVRREEEVEEKMGLIGGLAGAFDDALPAGLGKRLGIGDAVESTKALVSAGGGNVSKLEAGAHLAGQLGKNLMKSLGPYALLAMAIQELVDAFKFIDNSSGEIAKNFGVSAAEGQRMVASANEAAIASGDLLVNTEDVVKAQFALNKTMGSSVQFSGELAAEFASISERTGLSEEAMSMFAKKAIIAGTSIEEQLQKVTAVTMEMSAQSGIMVSQKEIQEGIGQMSAAQMLTAKMNTKEMAKQVFQTKLLGISQSQLENTASSLLDFESSIGAEMEAELLTGKQLNLEGARQAALMGDQARLAEELRKEVGTAADFGSMNVIQQEAMAKAFGMQREDMAKMLVEQEKLEAVKKAGFKSTSDAQEQYNEALKKGNLTEELKLKLQEAGMLNQLESATAADKLAAAQDKIKDLFIAIMEPLMPILNILTDVLEKAITPLMPILKAVADLIGGIIAPILEMAFAPIQIAVQGLQDVASMFDDLLPKGTEMGDIFKTIGKIIGTFIAVPMNIFKAGITFIVERVKGLAGIFKGIIQIFQGDFEEGFKTIARGAIGMILAPIQAVVAVVLGVINSIIEGLNYIPGVDIGTINTPDLAGLVGGLVGLEEGGIVTQPTAALIGEGSEPEAVMPLSKLTDMLPSIGGAASGLMDAATAPARGIIGAVSSLFGGDDDDVSQLKELNEKMNRLIAAVEKGGDVFIDGAKAGKSMAMATSRIG